MRLSLATAAVTPLLLAAALTPALAGPSDRAPASDADATAAAPPRVLVWGGAYGFRHPSITTGELTMLQLAQSTGKFTATVTENPADLTLLNLRNYDALMWISTTGKAPMLPQQRDEVVKWSACGGGNIGIHAALDSEYGWAEHAEIFGAQFDSHPQNVGDPAARMHVEDRTDPIVAGWSSADNFMFQDEYYRWRTAKGVPGVSLPRNLPDTEVLLSLDETSVKAGIQTGATPYEDDQPVAWKKTFRGGGRVFYNNMGHSESTWNVPAYRTSLVNAVEWVGGVRPDAKCLDSTAPLPPSPYTPPAPDVETVGKACTVPTLRQRTGGVWETSGPARAVGTTDTQRLAGGLPGNLGWGAQTWVVDLSAARAATADVTVDLTWSNPAHDYDLSVATGWGFYGSDNLVGTAAEKVVLTDVPHCAVLHVAGDNMLAAGGDGTTATITVTPDAPAVPGNGLALGRR